MELYFRIDMIKQVNFLPSIHQTRVDLLSHLAIDGHQVMFAHGEHVDVLHDHHLVVVFVKDGVIQHVCGDGNNHGKPSAFTFDHFHSLTKLGEMPQQGRRCGCEPVLGTVQLQLSDHKLCFLPGRLIAFSAAEGLIKHFICLRPRRRLSHATEHFFNFLTGYLFAGLEGRAGGRGWGCWGRLWKTTVDSLSASPQHRVSSVFVGSRWSRFRFSA